MTTYYDPELYAFIQIFKGSVVCDGNVVPIKSRFGPGDDRPCITMNKKGGTGDGVKEFAMKLPLDIHHPHYDSDNPTEEYVQKIRNESPRRKVLEFHIWGRSVEERDCIYQQMLTIIEDAIELNYRYCTNYNKVTQLCTTTGLKCDAIGATDTYGVYGMCPATGISDEDDPNYRNPSSYLTQAGITPDMIEDGGENYIIDLDLYPEEYRVVWEISYHSQTAQERTVNPACKVTIKEEF